MLVVPMGTHWGYGDTLGLWRTWTPLSPPMTPHSIIIPIFWPFYATFSRFPHFIHGKQIAETILTPDCSQSCTCRGPGGLQCRPFTCPFGHTCGLRNGTRACIARPGRCALSPATRFVTFDGVTGGSLATGIYVVASLCDPRDPAWFRLLGDVRDIGDQPAVVALHLFSPHSFITVQRDRKVWVSCHHPGWHPKMLSPPCCHPKRPPDLHFN